MKTELRFSHDREPVQMFTYMFGEPDRCSHRTRIRFSEFSVSFLLGSSCSSSHLGLLLFSCCHYFFSHTAITFLPLLFFSLYYYYSSFLMLLLFSHYYCSLFIGITLLFITIYFFPIAIILFLLLLLFSHSVALFVWWSHLIINYLVIKTDFN